MAGVARKDMTPEESCRLFCAWKGGGACLADDCPRKKHEHVVCVRPNCNGATAKKLDGSLVCVMCGVIARSAQP